MHRPVIIGLLATLAAGCQTIGGAVDRITQPDLRGEMADSDVDLAVAALQTTLESEPDGSAASWSNQETGTSGSITPTRTYQTDAGYFCRAFTEVVVMGTRTATYDDEACRTDDGTWYLVES